MTLRVNVMFDTIAAPRAEQRGAALFAFICKPPKATHSNSEKTAIRSLCAGTDYWVVQLSWKPCARLPVACPVARSWK